MKEALSEEDVLVANAQKCGIPDYMIGGLVRYVVNRIPPGGFLMAVLENDFMEACGRADDTNSECLKAYAMFLYNYVPSNCKGSPEAVAAWLADPGREPDDEGYLAAEGTPVL